MFLVEVMEPAPTVCQLVEVNDVGLPHAILVVVREQNFGTSACEFDSFVLKFDA